VSERPPDVEIAARVRAKELRFECKPQVVTRAYANVRASARSSSERENLPGELDAGVTYRDLAVRWSLAARIEDPGGDGAERG
jgi:hypothetical protein